MKKIFSWLIGALFALSLGGCGTTMNSMNASSATEIPLAFSPDGMAVAGGLIIGATFDGMKESIYTVCLLKKARSPAEQAIILKKPTEFSWGSECEVRDTKRYANNPLLRDIFASTVPTLVATVVKGEMDKEVVRASCKGSCAGGGGAGAASNNNVEINITNGCTGTTCGR